jgi:hypothetical protein
MRAHNDAEAGESLVRSRQRVIEHGEVFTPRWLVRDMVDLVVDEATRADARFLEAFSPTWIQNGLFVIKGVGGV